MESPINVKRLKNTILKILPIFIIVHLLVEKVERVSPGFLGLIHGGVGLFE